MAAMDETGQTSADRDSHQVQVERSRRIWDRRSSHDWLWNFADQDTIEYRREAIERLDLNSGDTALDVGCGRGPNFELLYEAVGPEGQILGIDYSPEMIRKARERIAEHGWENVEVMRADATRINLESGKVDGAVATTAVSAMPDVRAVIETVYDALRPGSRFGLYEIRLVPSGPTQALNPLILWFYQWFGNWNTEEDVLEQLQAEFDRVEVVRTFAFGTNYVAVAEKANHGKA